MRTQRTPKRKSDTAPRKGVTERERQLRDEAAADEVLREQSKTEVEECPYLDTEGGE